jgi:hypothetical protein
MTSTRRAFRPRFADGVSKGDIISLRFDGSEALSVYAPPVKIANLTGHRTYVMLHVQLIDTGKTGQMIFPSSGVVFIRDKENET